MWIWTALASACLLGVYDVAKKQALKKNGVLGILLGATALTSLFLCPFLEKAPLPDHLFLLAKAALVTTSWISGLAALKLIPLTTASTIKASRPVLVVIFSIILFGERLNIWQWGGVALALSALFVLSRSSKSEGVDFTNSKGILLMLVSVITGASSAMLDKHIMSWMEPLFVQSWTNVYITAMLATIMIVRHFMPGVEDAPLRWDWYVVLIAVLITGADALYFYSLSKEGSLVSVISLIRRSSVIITFAMGAIFFKEKNIASKAVSLGILLAGIVLLMLGSTL